MKLDASVDEENIEEFEVFKNIKIGYEILKWSFWGMFYYQFLSKDRFSRLNFGALAIFDQVFPSVDLTTREPINSSGQ